MLLGPSPRVGDLFFFGMGSGEGFTYLVQVSDESFGWEDVGIYRMLKQDPKAITRRSHTRWTPQRTS